MSVLESTKFQRWGFGELSCLWTTVTLMKVNLYRIFWLEVTLFRHPIHSAVMDIKTWTPEGDRSHWSHSVEWRPLSVGCFVKVSLGENFHPNEQMKSAFDKLQLTVDYRKWRQHLTLVIYYKVNKLNLWNQPGQGQKSWWHLDQVQKKCIVVIFLYKIILRCWNISID